MDLGRFAYLYGAIRARDYLFDCILTEVGLSFLLLIRLIPFQVRAHMSLLVFSMRMKSQFISCRFHAEVLWAVLRTATDYTFGL